MARAFLTKTMSAVGPNSDIDMWCEEEHVDLADFAILVGNFNTKGKFVDGDFDFNGRIEIKDFVKFREVFNLDLRMVYGRCL